MRGWSDKNCTLLEEILDDQLEYERNIPTDPSGERWIHVVSYKPELIDRCYHEPGHPIWLPAVEYHAPGFPTRDRGESTTMLTVITEAGLSPRAAIPCSTSVSSNVYAETSEHERLRIIRQEYDIHRYAEYMDRCGIPFPRPAAGDVVMTKKKAHSKTVRAAAPPQPQPQLEAAERFLETYSIGFCDKLASLATPNFAATIQLPNGTEVVNITTFVQQCQWQAVNQIESYTWLSRVSMGSTAVFGGISGLAFIDPTTHEPCAIQHEISYEVDTVTDGQGNTLVASLNEFTWTDFQRICTDRCHFQCI